MKKFCCLILMLMLCMSTTYAARGKECIKYLCGEWAIPNTDTIYYFDNMGALEPPESQKVPIYNEPAIRYKYKSIDESSYINDATGKGTIILSFDNAKMEYEFANFKRMRFRYYKNPEWSPIYTKYSDTLVHLKNTRIIDYDSFVESPIGDGTYLYTPVNGGEQLKLVIARNQNRKHVMNIYNKDGKSIFQHTFYEDSGLTVRKVHYRSGKSDLICYDQAGTGNYIMNFFILGMGSNGFGKLYDIGKDINHIGSNPSVWFEYDSIYLQGVNGYNGADGRGLKRNPIIVIAPSMQ